MKKYVCYFFDIVDENNNELPDSINIANQSDTIVTARFYRSTKAYDRNSGDTKLQGESYIKESLSSKDYVALATADNMNIFTDDNYITVKDIDYVQLKPQEDGSFLFNLRGNEQAIGETGAINVIAMSKVDFENLESTGDYTPLIHNYNVPYGRQYFNYEIVEESEPEHTHTFGDWTANEDGKTHTRTCTDGDSSETEDHNWVKYEKEDIQEGENYTNGEWAYEFYECKDCGFKQEVYYEMYVESEELDSLEKDGSEYVFPVNEEVNFFVKVVRYTENIYGTTEETVSPSDYKLEFAFEADSYGLKIVTEQLNWDYYGVRITAPYVAGSRQVRFLIHFNGKDEYDYTTTKSGYENWAFHFNMYSVEKNDQAGISYTTHVENEGWQSAVSNGETAGTIGKSLRLEGIKINLENADYDGSIEYATHIQNIGWQDWKKDGDLSGTTGQSLRLEAIKIRLTGELAEYYDVYYQVHAQNFGWLGWAKNGEAAGTGGYSYRLEGIRIMLVAKGDTDSVPSSSAKAYKRTQLVSYTTHVQNVGWQSEVLDGAMSGTSGQSLRLEGIKIRLVNQDYSGNIEYSTHVQNVGWQNYVKNGTMSGTSGQSLRLEGIKIRLTGEMAEHYDVYYRVHVQNIGWQSWKKNDEMAGTSGQSLRLEGIEIKLVEK